MQKNNKLKVDIAIFGGNNSYNVLGQVFRTALRKSKGEDETKIWNHGAFIVDYYLMIKIHIFFTFLLQHGPVILRCNKMSEYSL